MLELLVPVAGKGAVARTLGKASSRKVKTWLYLHGDWGKGVATLQPACRGNTKIQGYKQSPISFSGIFAAYDTVAISGIWNHNVGNHSGLPVWGMGGYWGCGGVAGPPVEGTPSTP